MGSKQISTIPPTVPFADALAKGLIERTKKTPEALSTYRIILPTQRACRTIQDAFLRQSDGQALLLPNLEAIGHADEDELNIFNSAYDFGINIAPAIHPMTRIALLSKLLREQESFEGNYAQSLSLAQDLAKFMDEIYIEDKKLNDLHDLVDVHELSEHWQMTIDFLSLLRDKWPKILSENGVIDAMHRRNLILKAQANLWTQTKPSTPIIAAGITGSVPATNTLFKAILSLPKGEIILPGFDIHMNDKTYDALDENHPQHSFKLLLKNLDSNKSSVQLWPDLINKGQTNKEEFIHAVMAPANETNHWQTISLQKNAADHINLIECKDYDQESSVVACILRDALQDDKKSQTAALVTADRALAARVQEKMKRWGIQIDDSAGKKLANTEKGLYLRSIIHTALSDFSPVSLLSLFKNGMCGNALIESLRKEVRAAELKLRGPFIKRDLQKLSKLLPKLSPIIELLKPFEDKTYRPLKDWIEIHIQCAEDLSDSINSSGEERLWAGDDGEALSQFFQELLSQSHDFDTLDLDGYNTLLDQFLRNQTIRPKYGSHPKLTILGQMESRLYHADIMVMSGLNEGSWPQDANIDPWMSRPMRSKFGLPTPEQKIGFAAHDFVQSICAQKIFLTRSKTIDGTPQISSRWLQRMETVLKATNIKLSNCDHYIQWAKDLYEHSGDIRPCTRPAPSPEKKYRPTTISVTGVESWMKDPYEIYAKYILKLRKIDELEKELDIAQYGSIVHDVLYDFIKDNPVNIPNDAAEQLKQIFIKHCNEFGLEDAENLAYFPRFQAFSNWFINEEKSNRNIGSRAAILEEKGSYTFNNDNGSTYTITAKADRIDKTATQEAVIIDYKTGSSQNQSAVSLGHMPQLPLEGLIAKNGGFKGLNPNDIQSLEYWRLTGKEGKEGEVFKLKKVSELITQAEDGIKNLFDCFDNDNTPYYSIPNEQIQKPEAFQDYAHLARIKEWATEEEGEEI